MHPTHYALTTALLVAITLAAPGAALHCNGDIIAVHVGPETLYLDDRSGKPGDIDHWLYLESNGVEGLQSGGDDICFDCSWLFSFTDPCFHAAQDTLLI